MQPYGHARATPRYGKVPVRIRSRRLRGTIGLILRLASSDLETFFQRTIPKEVWDQIREGAKRIAGYDAWSNDKVVPLLGGQRGGRDRARAR